MNFRQYILGSKLGIIHPILAVVLALNVDRFMVGFTLCLLFLWFCEPNRAKGVK